MVYFFGVLLLIAVVVSVDRIVARFLNRTTPSDDIPDFEEPDNYTYPKSTD